MNRVINQYEDFLNAILATSDFFVRVFFSSICTFRGFRAVFTLFILSFSFLASSAEPLWKYAKDHWSPAPYLISVVHEGRFSKKEMPVLNLLRSAQRERIVDLEILDSELRDLRIKRGGRKLPKLPYMVLRQHGDGSGAPILSLPFSKRSVDTVLDSPVRLELGKRLVSGDSAVFLLVDGRNSRENRAAALLLRDALKRLEKRLKAPSITRFSVLRLPRTQNERCLTSIILHSDPDLKKVSSPIVVPVFGRSRALPAFYGKGINKYNIGAAVDTLMSKREKFLKSEMSGFDLLTSTDWNSRMGVVRDSHSQIQTPLISMAVAARSSEELESLDRGDERPAGSRLKRSVALKPSSDNRVLITSVVITASLLLLIFSALIARSLQEKTDIGKS